MKGGEGLEVNKNKEVVEEDIGVEDGEGEEVNSEKKEEVEEETQEVVNSQRQVCPRVSKTRHKLLSKGTHAAKDTVPSNVGRNGTRKNHH